MGVVVRLRTRHAPPRVGSSERFVLGKRLAIEYRSGASIRAIAEKHRLSYYLTREVLIESGITFRFTARRSRLRLVRPANDLEHL